MPECRWVLLALALFASFAARADIGADTSIGASHIALPRDGDEYAKLVARTAAGDQGVDFRALRFAYLKSAARKRGAAEVDGLRNALAAAVTSGDDTRVRAAAETLLSVDFADLDGQNLLSLACTHLHDAPYAKQAEFVAFGLLKSIVDSGDGKSCKTGWEVVSVREEYVVLGVLDVTPKNQSLIAGPPSCDALEATDHDGKSATWYFRVDAVLEDERAMFGGPQTR